ncbi:MAG TPA: heme exporter protein CcmD [Pyrinomonadaceae bacterium]
MDWSMGGYGFYVWGSYLFAFVAIALEVYSLSRRKRSCEAQVDSRGQLKGSRNQ